MQRVQHNPHTLLIDVQTIYDMIEQDLVSNSNEVIHRFDYYTKKYRGDRLNDVNVGIFINDKRQIVTQIYVNNNIDTIKTHLIFSNDGRRISTKEEIINTYTDCNMEIRLNAYDEKPLEYRFSEAIDKIIEVTEFNSVEVINRVIEGEEIVYSLKGIK